MDEFDASATPTEGREATAGRGATWPGPTAPVIAPAPVAQSPALDVTVSRPSPLASVRELHTTAPLPPILPLPMPEPSRPGPDLQRAVAEAVSLSIASASHAPVRDALVAPPPASSVPRTGFRYWFWARRAAYYAAIAFIVWFASVIAQIALFRVVDPPYSNLMLLQRLSGEVLVHKWLPIERIPAQVIRAIVVSEDGRFCSHRGIDLKEIEIAIENSKDGTPRGASTITMQVAKNLFLWPSKSYIRKALELPITLAIEAMWSKRRIFEVYANIAEWGPGIFGVEAAAGYHFGKSAGRVSEREAALLAVALPNPVTRDAGDPGPGTERLANTIQARMRAMSRAASCVERPARP